MLGTRPVGDDHWRPLQLRNWTRIDPERAQLGVDGRQLEFELFEHQLPEFLAERTDLQLGTSATEVYGPYAVCAAKRLRLTDQIFSELGKLDSPVRFLERPVES